MRIKQIYFTPKEFLNELKVKHSRENVIELLESVKSPKLKLDREKIFGIIYVSGLRSITQQDYRLTLPEFDTDTDIEVINVNEYEKNQLLPRGDKKPDHFKIQNVQITNFDFNKAQSSTLKFWDVINNHIRKKIQKKTDYSNCVLVLHLRANVRGITEDILNKIREVIRENEDMPFREIWITGITSKSASRGVIAEIIQNDQPFIEFLIPS